MQELRCMIHGRTIELSSDPGITDGCEVVVTIRPVIDRAAQIAAIHDTAGCMAGDVEFDTIMNEIERDHRGHSDSSHCK